MSNPDLTRAAEGSTEMTSKARGARAVHKEAVSAVHLRQLVDDGVARHVQIVIPAIRREIVHKETSDNDGDERSHADDEH